MTDTERRVTVTRASDIKPDWPGAVISEAVRRAVLDVLPEEWRVLPDGRATHSVIATEAARRVADKPTCRECGTTVGVDPDDDLCSRCRNRKEYRR